MTIHPAHRFSIRAFALAILVLAMLSGCTTPASKESPEEHNLKELLTADGIYVLRGRQIYETAAPVAQLYIAEVWRHDPRLGSAPDIGTPWKHGLRGVLPGLAADSLIGLVRSDADGVQIHFALPVVDDKVTGLKMSPRQLRQLLGELPVGPESNVGSSIDFYVRRAVTVYVLECEASGGSVLATVAEILKEDPASPAPGVGQDVPWHAVGGATSAVTIVFEAQSSDTKAPAMQSVTLPVFEGRVAPDLTLNQLRFKMKHGATTQ